MWFICLFFPSLIALYIHSKKYKIKKIEYIMLYGIYTALVNMFASIICLVASSQMYYSIEKTLFTFSFSAKYLILTCTFSFLLPYILKYLKDNFKISIILRRKKND